MIYEILEFGGTMGLRDLVQVTKMTWQSVKEELAVEIAAGRVVVHEFPTSGGKVFRLPPVEKPHPPMDDREEKVLQTLRSHHDPITVHGLHRVTDGVMSRWALRELLDSWVEEGLVKMVSRGGLTLYRLK